MTHVKAGRKIEPIDEQSSVPRAFERITHNREYDYLEGVVFTKHGIVLVYSQGDDQSMHMTRLDFIHQGTHFIRQFKRRYSKRWIVTLARKFAEEASGNE